MMRVPLPGEDGTSLPDGMARWLTSPAMTTLLDAFGFPPLRPSSPLAENLAVAERCSERWDYRKGWLERHEAAGEDFPPALDALIRTTTTALGLVGRQQPSFTAYDHILVLGGGIRTMMARSSLTADILHSGVQASTVAALSSMRPLQDHEETARILGLRPCPTEAEGADEALRSTFHLDVPCTTRTGPDWWVRSYPDARPQVHVLAVPSTRPGLRANTADGFTGWIQLAAPHPHRTRLLLVTTDLYVPFQHCNAVRLLGLPYGCTIDTVGFSMASSEYIAAARTFELLQEVRSTIHSMQALYFALR
ncbi:hypothetical protein OHA72_01400 [Dactylosporangium sp. NBC_01737]|uniref:hypothetical protein n=1 Tax=Dactylosporangium sp. NBC_01737 TaxID=2975959 RepID=UPI002E115256|nr:hypothetical protein OHA72_01400 [Dactylosporangium sp. NBC_01737]